MQEKEKEKMEWQWRHKVYGGGASIILLLRVPSFITTTTHPFIFPEVSLPRYLKTKSRQFS